MFSFENVENSYILRITNVSMSQKGKYVLEAANKLGNLVVDFELDVLSKLWFKFKKISKYFFCIPYYLLEPPKINKRQKEYAVLSNKPVRVEFELVGVPEPTVEYFLNNQIIENPKVEKTQFKHVLFLDSLNLDKNALLEVKAKNEVGNDQVTWDLLFECNLF